MKSRDKVGQEYGLGHASVARLLRLNALIIPLRKLVDDGALPLYAAVDLSYLPDQAQRWVLEVSSELRFPLTMKNARVFKERKDELTRELIYDIMRDIQASVFPRLSMSSTLKNAPKTKCNLSWSRR